MIKKITRSGHVEATKENGYTVSGQLPEELLQGLLDFIKTLESIEEEQDKILVEQATDDIALMFITKFPYWDGDEDYDKGDRVRWQVGTEEKLYKALNDIRNNNWTWEPQNSPSLWVDLTGKVPGDSGYPKWIQPGGSTDAYEKGFEVEHKGIIYKSIVDNNVWEPGVYGWDEV